MVLSGSLGQHHLSSWLSLNGLQKLPREGDKRTIETEIAPCAKTQEGEREWAHQERVPNSAGVEYRWGWWAGSGLRGEPGPSGRALLAWPL